AFSRLEKKRLPIRMEPGDLSEVFAEVQNILGENLAREGVTLNVDNKVAAPVDYDREALVQIFLNLVENSAKFSKDAPEKQITLFARPGKGWVEAGVSDTGPGIEPKDLKRIFREFYRSRRDESVSRGTGIGLALVRSLAQAMGGTVSAKNNPNGGCTVAVRLRAGKEKE
ncbi:MAG: HAMP domain-containing sensor histidine kinase, partial [Pseudomonadota bacterium]